MFSSHENPGRSRPGGFGIYVDGEAVASASNEVGAADEGNGKLVKIGYCIGFRLPVIALEHARTYRE